MTRPRQFATGIHGQTNDDDLRWDDGDFRWGDSFQWSEGGPRGEDHNDHRGDCGGHGHHSAIHSDLIIPVAPTATSGDFDLHAVLDSPGATQGRPLLILVSGFTYDHQYWDPPVGGGRYSFVDAANHAGYATLNLDRLGMGTSDRPPADLTSIQQQADELHQIIQSLRSGALSGYGFSEIVLVGHSLGSAIAQTEANTYGDVSALVLTGFRHEVNPAGAGEFISSIHPADGQPAGYLTMDSRDLLFDLNNTSPDILAWDAAHIGTGTAAELDFGFALDPVQSVGISVPVLEVVGDHDLLFQTDPSTFAAERGFYSNSSDFEQLIVRNAGHDVTLERNAQQTFHQMLDFIENAVPDHHHYDLTA
jgi:pimeloyl-ACP methyl ester carboxylesterase